MIGSPVDYDKKFKENFPLHPAKLDWELKRYLNLIHGKEVLDLGIGQGRNYIPLAKLGYHITGVDFSYKNLEICKEICPELNLSRADIRDFEIEKDKYDLISSRCVLHFFHKDDMYAIVHNIKKNLKSNGLVYIQVFSVEDPKLQRYTNSDNFEMLENNIFHNIVNNTFVSFFTKNEILDLFNDFQTISISEEYSLDQGSNTPYYSGIIKYIGQKS